MRRHWFRGLSALFSPFEADFLRGLFFSPRIDEVIILACKNVCQLCPRLAISTDVAFTGGNLVITLPQDTYRNGEKVCIVIAQTIPQDTTITAPVVIQIGAGTVQYPLTNRCCAHVTACGVRTRTRYATRVVTSATGAAFRMLGSPMCSPSYALETIDGTDPTSLAGGNG